MKLVNWAKVDRYGHLEREDDPDVTEARRSIIWNKKFLRKVYADNYRIFKKFRDELGEGVCVEIGSGAGFIKKVIPGVITSDILAIRGIDLRLNALQLPFKSNSIAAFFFQYTFHHLKDARAALSELCRCLRPGGKVIILEGCADNPWSNFVTRFIHHETSDRSAGWTVDGEGALTDSNAALTWIVFKRDRDILEKQFPLLRLRRYEAVFPLRYLLSGGVTGPEFLPGYLYGLVVFLERILSPLNPWIGMFQVIELEKVHCSG